MSPLRVLLFDIFGTVVDWRSSLIDIAEETGTQGDWPAIVDDWRRAYQPSLEKARQDSGWRDLDAVQRDTLDECLERLRAGYVTATLSNGHVALLADLLKFGDLRFDAVLSAQLAASYKPDPVVYL